MADDAHYDYRFEDRSLLLRWTERPLLIPLVRALPAWLTPNQLTVAGHLCAATAVTLAFALQPLPAAGLVAMAAGILAYVLADAIDGLYARHSGKTSRLGEMLDHWLDAFTVPLVVLSFAVVLQAPPLLALLSVLACGLLHYTTLLHGFRVGFVLLGEIGVIEGFCVGALACLAAAAFGTEMFTRPLLGGVALGPMLLIGFVAGACLAFGPMRGAFRHASDFAGVGLTLAAVAVWFALGRLPLALAGALGVLTSAHGEGGVLRARLLRLPFRPNDPLLLALTLAGLAASLALDLSRGAQTALAAAAVAYGAARAVITFARTAAALRCPVAAAPASVPAVAATRE